jgi:benzoate-CoA ligase family protein
VTFVPAEWFNMVDYFLDGRIREGLGGKEALRLDNASLTYAEVLELSRRFAGALRRLGVRQEERVLIALPDSPAYVASLFGILRMGAVAVMINPELRSDHLAAILRSSRASAALVDPEYLPALEAASTWHRPQLMVVDGDDAPGPADTDLASTHRDDPAIWLFSGGTTGVPKIVVQTHRSFVNTTELYAKAAMGYHPEDVTISVPKLYFGYATGSNLLFPFSVGATAVLFPEKPTPAVILEKIRRHRPTILINVPSMVNQMVTDLGARPEEMSCLRFATAAGEALPETLYHRWVDAFGVELLDGLGTAEMWHIFISNLPGDVRPGTLGKVVPGFEIRVRDEAGEDLPEGEVGRLWVRGGSRALGYWQDLEQTQAGFRGEWFVGGDLVSRDADGYVTHRGRADDAIKVKGKWLSPQEVESCLLEHQAVKECAVIGVEDEDGLLKPVAFVVAVEDVSEKGLKEHVLARLEPYKHPRRVYFLDALPQTHLGKVDRGQLRRLAR